MPANAVEMEQSDETPQSTNLGNVENNNPLLPVVKHLKEENDMLRRIIAGLQLRDKGQQTILRIKGEHVVVLGDPVAERHQQLAAQGPPVCRHENPSESTVSSSGSISLHTPAYVRGRNHNGRGGLELGALEGAFELLCLSSTKEPPPASPRPTDGAEITPGLSIVNRAPSPIAFSTWYANIGCAILSDNRAVKDGAVEQLLLADVGDSDGSDAAAVPAVYVGGPDTNQPLCKHLGRYCTEESPLSVVAPIVPVKFRLWAQDVGLSQQTPQSTAGALTPAGDVTPRSSTGSRPMELASPFAEVTPPKQLHAWQAAPLGSTRVSAVRPRLHSMKMAAAVGVGLGSPLACRKISAPPMASPS